MDMMADMGDMEGGQVVIGTRGVLMNMTWYPMVLLLLCTPLKSSMMSTLLTFSQLLMCVMPITPMKLP